MSQALIARAPTRIDFGGGWTDVPPYPEAEGGAVCNVAIARYATATVAMNGHVAARNAGGDQARDDRLVAAALRRAGIAGAEAVVTSDYPVGAGLGGSSAAGVALAGALAELAGESLDCAAVAARSRATEVEELGVAGGYQDHLAAAYGGALLITLGDCIAVERLELSAALRESLARRVVLLYTGESRLSGNTINAVLDAYRARDARVCDSLARMKALAVQMAAALRAGDLDALGELVEEHWAYQRVLHPAITTTRIDAAHAAALNAGAIGVKALGASGGGCMIAVARDGREDELARALAPFGERLPYAVDDTGFHVLARMSGRQEADES